MLIFAHLASKETGGETQIYHLGPRWWDFEGFQHWIFLDNRTFTSERVPALKFHHVLVLSSVGEQLRVTWVTPEWCMQGLNFGPGS